MQKSKQREKRHNIFCRFTCVRARAKIHLRKCFIYIPNSCHWNIWCHRFNDVSFECVCVCVFFAACFDEVFVYWKDFKNLIFHLNIRNNITGQNCKSTISSHLSLMINVGMLKLKHSPTQQRFVSYNEKFLLILLKKFYCAWKVYFVWVIFVSFHVNKNIRASWKYY